MKKRKERKTGKSLPGPLKQQFFFFFWKTCFSLILDLKIKYNPFIEQ